MTLQDLQEIQRKSKILDCCDFIKQKAIDLDPSSLDEEEYKHAKETAYKKINDPKKKYRL